MKLNSELIRKTLKEKGLNQVDMCKALDIKWYNLSKYLSGANTPTNIGRNIADYLGLSIFEIQQFKGFTDY